MQFNAFGYTFETLEGKTNEVALKKAVNASGRFVIPKRVEYNGTQYQITQVGTAPVEDMYGQVLTPKDRDPNGDTQITSILLTDAVTALGGGCFRFSKKLESINIPLGIKIIPYVAFCDCPQLKSIELPGVTKIMACGFYGCESLASVKLGNQLKSISESAFQKCNSLKEITIPTSVESIGKEAFEGCKSLKEIIIPSSVESIGEKAFADSGLTKVEIQNDEGEVMVGQNAFPSSAVVTYTGKKAAKKVVETPKPQPKPEPAPAPKPQPKPAPKPEPKPAPQPTSTANAGSGTTLNVAPTKTVGELRTEFNQLFGSVLKVYSGRSVADDATPLKDINPAIASKEVLCNPNLTVGSFIERMKEETGLKVKVYTCDAWVAVLDGLTLHNSGLVKKNAVKADMESMIAYQQD